MDSLVCAKGESNDSIGAHRLFEIDKYETNKKHSTNGNVVSISHIKNIYRGLTQ